MTLLRPFAIVWLASSLAVATGCAAAASDESNANDPSETSSSQGADPHAAAGGHDGGSPSNNAGGQGSTNPNGSGSTGSAATGSSSANSSSSSGGSPDDDGPEHSNCAIMSSNPTCATCLQTYCCDVINACMDEDLVSCVGCMDCYLKGKGADCCDQSVGKNGWLVECVHWNCKKECGE